MSPTPLTSIGQTTTKELEFMLNSAHSLPADLEEDLYLSDDSEEHESESEMPDDSAAPVLTSKGEESESKAVLNAVSANFTETTFHDGVQKQRESKSTHSLPANLEEDLYLSDDSEVDESPKGIPSRPPRHEISSGVSFEVSSPRIPSMSSAIPPLSPMALYPVCLPSAHLQLTLVQQQQQLIAPQQPLANQPQPLEDTKMPQDEGKCESANKILPTVVPAAISVQVDKKKEQRTKLPALTYNNGVPRLMCMVELSKLQRVPEPTRRRKIRQRTELRDTRLSFFPKSCSDSGSDNSDCSVDKSATNTSLTAKPLEGTKTPQSVSPREASNELPPEDRVLHRKRRLLRRLFGDSPVKDGKGGKDGSQCECPNKMPPTVVPAAISVPVDKEVHQRTKLPTLTYGNGVPRLMCRVELSKLRHVPQPSRGQKMRQRIEIHAPVDDKSEAKPALVAVNSVVVAARDSACAVSVDNRCELATTCCGLKRKRKESSSSRSSLSTVCSVDNKIMSSAKEVRKKRKMGHQEQETVARFSSRRPNDVRPTNHYYKQNDVSEDLGIHWEQCLAEANRLKHSADEESDITTQGLLYLEGAIYFILTCQAMESVHISKSDAYSLYQEALAIIKSIATMFHVQANNSVENKTPIKLLILSLWCLSLIYQKLFNMRKDEIEENRLLLTEYYKKQVLVHPKGQGRTADSVGSRSTGYSGGELVNNGLANGQMPVLTYVSVPLSIHKAMQKQYNDMSMLMSSHDNWEKACALISDRQREFFIELDETLGPLTPESSLTNLMRYVQAGIKRLRAL